MLSDSLIVPVLRLLAVRVLVVLALAVLLLVAGPRPSVSAAGVIDVLVPVAVVVKWVHHSCQTPGWDRHSHPDLVLAEKYIIT